MQNLGEAENVAVADLAVLPLHKMCAVFPYDAKVVAVIAKGLRIFVPVTTFRGTLLDGKLRVAAAMAGGIAEIPAQEYLGDEAEAAQFTLSMNTHRAHFSMMNPWDIGARLARVDRRVSDAETMLLVRGMLGLTPGKWAKMQVVLADPAVAKKATAERWSLERAWKAHQKAEASRGWLTRQRQDQAGV